VIFFSPDGQTLQQNMVNGLANKTNMIFICGHYKGIDERIREKYVTQEISIGDYVLSGGELAAAVTADAIVRLIPGAIGDETSALTDSFQDGLLSAPVYTRPANFEGMEVPGVLLSGHDKKISEWRFEQSLSRTKQRRPDLLANE
jgi:tRNA (guanine37-N1)-methyltransferase